MGTFMLSTDRITRGYSAWRVQTMSKPFFNSSTERNAVYSMSVAQRFRGKKHTDILLSDEKILIIDGNGKIYIRTK